MRVKMASLSSNRRELNFSYLVLGKIVITKMKKSKKKKKEHVKKLKTAPKAVRYQL